MGSNTEPQDSGWDRGWEEHRRRQLIRMSKLTLAQKIQWLEDMQAIFEQLTVSRTQSPKATGSSQNSPKS